MRLKHSKAAWDIDLIYWVNDVCIIYGEGLAASGWCGFHEVLGIAKNPAWKGVCPHELSIKPAAHGNKKCQVVI